MRVLQVAHALPADTYGGVELYTVRLAEALADRGNEVAVAAPRGANADLPVEAIPLPEPEGVQEDRGLGAVVDARVDARMATVLDRFDPDVVHLQHFKGLSAALPTVCAERGIACIATLHDFWTLCHREQLYRPEGERCSGPESVAKCTDCYLRATGMSEGERSREFYAEVVADREATLRDALAATDRLIAPSKFLQERFIVYDIDPDRIIHRRNGIKTWRFEDNGFDPDTPLRVGYVGRITPKKGVHLLVEAFDNVDGETTLEVFGRFAPDKEDYHARLAQAAGDQVRFHGRYEDPASPYHAIDVLALPSLWYENSPFVIQEAFAAGVPVVTADVGGMAELVDHGVDGLTFAAGSMEALKDALNDLAADPGAVQRLREGVEEPERLDDHARKLAALYAKCAQRPEGRA